MKRIIVTALYCLTLILNLNAQPIKTGSQFSVESLPDSIKKNWVSGKPAIIYVFSSHCSNSFTSLPQLKHLQQQYSTQVQFLLIGRADETIEPTYHRFALWYNLHFPFSMDSHFHKKLDTGYLPTLIWVDRLGRITALTGNYEATNDNIKLFLEGKSIHVKQYLSPDVLTGILKGLDNDSTVLVRSELTEWTKEEPVGVPFAIDFEKNYFQALGVSLKQLYYFAFTGKTYWASDDPLYNNFAKLIVVDSFQAALCSVDWEKLYNYRIAFKKTPDSIAFLKTLQEDLNRSMPYTAKVENRMMPYWKLVIKNGDTTRFSPKHSHTKGIFTLASVNYENHPFKWLVVNLQLLYTQEQPIIDETGISGNVDLKFEAIMSDRSSLRQGLQQAGLDLIEGHKLMDTIVLTPKEINVAIKH